MFFRFLKYSHMRQAFRADDVSNKISSIFHYDIFFFWRSWKFTCFSLQFTLSMIWTSFAKTNFFCNLISKNCPQFWEEKIKRVWKKMWPEELWGPFHITAKLYPNNVECDSKYLLDFCTKISLIARCKCWQLCTQFNWSLWLILQALKFITKQFVSMTVVICIVTSQFPKQLRLICS